MCCYCCAPPYIYIHNIRKYVPFVSYSADTGNSASDGQFPPSSSSSSSAAVVAGSERLRVSPSSSSSGGELPAGGFRFPVVAEESECRRRSVPPSAAGIADCRRVVSVVRGLGVGRADSNPPPDRRWMSTLADRRLERPRPPGRDTKVK